MRIGAAGRLRALIVKDLAELWRQPGAVLPPIVIAFGAMLPAFLVAVVVPALTRESMSQSRDLVEMTRGAAGVVRGLEGLSADAQVQALLFHQFSLLMLMVPVVGAMAIASHAIIGEKTARTLEPLLATPLSTAELLAAKVLTPCTMALVLMGATLATYLSGIAWVGEPGVWRTFVGVHTLVQFGLIGPLLTWLSLLLAVIMSSRVNDSRTAQQLGVLVILPLTALFVGQLIAGLVLTTTILVAAAAVLLVLDVALMWVGTRVFDREHILTRWR